MSEDHASQPSGSHAPRVRLSMLGGGCYNGNADIQRAAMQRSLSIFPTTLDDALSSEKLLTVVDYGASEGVNSILPLSHIASALSDGIEKTDAANHCIDIQYILSDTPFNDYCSLAKTLHEASKNWSKQWPGVGVFPHMVGRSFMEQIVPRARVHLGYSFSCLQWVNDSADLESIKPGETLLSTLIARQAACKSQADHDLYHFLRVRAREFHEGGTLIVSFVADSGPPSYWETPAFESIVIALDEMMDEGLIPATIKLSFFPPIYLRTLQQVQDILNLTDVGSVWSVQHLSEADVEHPFSSDLDRKNITSEKSQLYAEHMVDFTLAIVGRLLINAISDSGDKGELSAAQQDDILSRWREKAAAKFLDEFKDAKVEFRWIYASLKRKSDVA